VPTRPPILVPSLSLAIVARLIHVPAIKNEIAMRTSVEASIGRIYPRRDSFERPPEGHMPEVTFWMVK
jgi:hypothetical protein